MKNVDARNYQESVRERQPYHISLPGFISEDDVGLGDIIKRATSSIGIRPCDDCGKRAALLNRWIVISPWRRS